MLLDVFTPITLHTIISIRDTKFDSTEHILIKLRIYCSPNWAFVRSQVQRGGLHVCCSLLFLSNECMHNNALKWNETTPFSLNDLPSGHFNLVRRAECHKNVNYLKKKQSWMAVANVSGLQFEVKVGYIRGNDFWNLRGIVLMTMKRHFFCYISAKSCSISMCRTLLLTKCQPLWIFIPFPVMRMKWVAT